jgi:hypothetical protein
VLISFSLDAGLSGLVYLAILFLFARQAERSRTPSGISRVSRWTFLAQSTMDSVSFAGHITFAILAEGRPSLTLIAPAFLACALFVQEAVCHLSQTYSSKLIGVYLAILYPREFYPRAREFFPSISAGTHCLVNCPFCRRCTSSNRHPESAPSITCHNSIFLFRFLHPSRSYRSSS